jgi:nitrogen regulatory protein PII
LIIIRLEIIINDELVKPTVEVITKVAKKIAIRDVEKSLFFPLKSVFVYGQVKPEKMRLVEH